MSQNPLFVLVLAVSAMLTACGGGGGGADGNGATAPSVPDTPQPAESNLSLKVSYPTPNANVADADATHIFVTGYVIDNEDGEVVPSDIGQLFVNGVLATFDIDNPERWRVRVPLEADNLLEFSLSDSKGVTTRHHQKIFNDPLFGFPDSVALNNAGIRAYVIDFGLDALHAVDIDTGRRFILSDSERGSGPPFQRPFGVAIDEANNRVFVVDADLDALLAVDITTGNRTIVSPSGSGAAFVIPQNLVFDNANNRVLVSDSSGALISINLITGSRAVLSDFDRDIGDGPDISFQDIALDAPRNRVYVANTSPGSIYYVDLATGNRTVLSRHDQGAGPNLISPRGLAFDPGNNRLVVTDGGFNALVSVDTATGNRHIISDDETGSGAGLNFPNGIVLDGANNRALITEGNAVRDALVAVDLATGNRTYVKNGSSGRGLAFQQPTGIVYDGDSRAFVIDEELQAVVSIDLATGNRTIFSDLAAAVGAEAIASRGVAIDLVRNRLIAIVNYGFDPGSEPEPISAIVAIDLDTGQSTILSSSSVGGGPEFVFPTSVDVDPVRNRAIIVEFVLDELFVVDLATGNRSTISVSVSHPAYIAVDESNNRAILTDREEGVKALVAIDLSSGNRTVLSDATTGTGNPFREPTGVALDVSNNRAIVLDLADRLFAVDLDTGNRTVISDNAVGTGIRLDLPSAITLDSANNRVLVINYVVKAVVAIDLASGDRSIVSQ